MSAPVFVPARTRAVAAPRGRSASGPAARLGGIGITLPPEAGQGSGVVDNGPPISTDDLTRRGRRELHQAHRQRSRHTRLTPDERRQKSRRGRADRWTRRHQMRPITTLKSVKACGVAAIPVKGEDGDIVGTIPTTLGVRTNEDGQRSAGYGGLQHCGSVWACPVCSATIATRRAGELARLLKWALDQGYSASMATFTLRHFKGQRLRDVWGAVSAGWKGATGGKRWVADQADHGLTGWVKAVEATHGANGWHVHLHVLMIWNRPDGEAVQRDARELAEAMHDRWTRAVQRKGFDSLRDSGGLDVRMASLDPESNGLHDYFTKMAFEVSGGYAKEAKGKGRAPFQILADAFDTGLADDFDLWEEWERGSRGRRQMAWSKGLKELSGIGLDQTDEEIANETQEADEKVVLTPRTRSKLLNNPTAAIMLLEVAEDDGLEAACAWLNERGLAWHRKGDPPPVDVAVMEFMTG